MYTRIIVPLDGSDVAEQAITPAIEFARRMGIPMHLIRIADLPHTEVPALFGFVGDGRFVAEQVRSEVALASEYLAENVRSLTELGLTVTSGVEVGMAARAIVDSTKPGDVIIMASHGRSGIARWYIGSVAEQVMRLSPVPVMVVRGDVVDAVPTQPPHIALAS